MSKDETGTLLRSLLLVASFAMLIASPIVTLAVVQSKVEAIDIAVKSKASSETLQLYMRQQEQWQTDMSRKMDSIYNFLLKERTLHDSMGTNKGGNKS